MYLVIRVLSKMVWIVMIAVGILVVGILAVRILVVGMAIAATAMIPAMTQMRIIRPLMAMVGIQSIMTIAVRKLPQVVILKTVRAT